MRGKRLLPLLLLATSLFSCGGTSNVSSENSPVAGEFHYEDPKTNIIKAEDEKGEDPYSRFENFADLSIETIAVIDKNGEVKAEAEDCDTRGCTLQAGCAGFIENTGYASGGQCIACISNPSILAFNFELKGNATIDFFTISSKYENPYDLDANVSYHIDKDKDGKFAYSLSSNGYTDFGHTETNQWYNFKEVYLGTLELNKGVHTMYIEVKGAFPNTDCFSLFAYNYTEVTD